MKSALYLSLLLLLSPLTPAAETADFLVPVRDELLQELQDFLVDDVFENPRALEQVLLINTDRALRTAQEYDAAQTALWECLNPQQAAQLSAEGRRLILEDCRTAIAQSVWCGSPAKMEEEEETHYPGIVDALISTQASASQTEINSNMARAAAVMEAYMQAARVSIASLLRDNRNPLTGQVWQGDQQQQAERRFTALLRASAAYRSALTSLSIPEDEEFWSTGLPMFHAGLNCKLLENEEKLLLLMLPESEE